MNPQAKMKTVSDRPSFQDLIVWQRLAIYKLTASFPTGGQFVLTNQLRRASFP
jgi:hypothetical protein